MARAHRRCGPKKHPLRAVSADSCAWLGRSNRSELPSSRRRQGDQECRGFASAVRAGCRLAGGRREVRRPCKGHFSLRDESPARRLGIASLSPREYGVCSKKLRKLARAPDIAKWLDTPSATLAVTQIGRAHV